MEHDVCSRYHGQSSYRYVHSKSITAQLLHYDKNKKWAPGYCTLLPDCSASQHPCSRARQSASIASQRAALICPFNLAPQLSLGRCGGLQLQWRKCTNARQGCSNNSSWRSSTQCSLRRKKKLLRLSGHRPVLK